MIHIPAVLFFAAAVAAKRWVNDQERSGWSCFKSSKPQEVTTTDSNAGSKK